MGKAAKRERREQRKLEDLVFQKFEKCMTKISEEEKDKFFIKTGILKFVDDKPVFDPQAYYKTAFTFMDKLSKIAEEANDRNWERKSFSIDFLSKFEISAKVKIITKEEYEQVVDMAISQLEDLKKW